MSLKRGRRRALLVPLLVTVLTLVATAACGDDADSDNTPAAAGAPSTTGQAVSGRALRISAIPDQDPSKLTEINGAMAEYLTTALGRPVEYVPVSDYASAVSLFKTGDIDAVFFGGLTGVQARLQAPGATLLAQRDIDEAFQSVFIASAGSGIEPIEDVDRLTVFEGKRFTFGSESSTSGRLMPEYFFDQAGMASARDFAGPVGYSGSHDKTIDLVQAGTYEGGALNLSVWKKRLAAGTVDTTKVREILVSPTYHDYHWIAGPDTDERFGQGFAQKIKQALLALDYGDPEQARLLDLYGAKRFTATAAGNYKEIERIGRKLGLIT